MKKLLLFLLPFTIMCIEIQAQTVVNVNNVRYLIEDGVATVGRQDKELSGDIVIPTSIEYEGNTYYVTGIVPPSNLTALSSNTVTTEGGAFQSCSITSIVIPNTIKNISAGAFSGCSQLSSIQLPGNLEGIGAASFSGCTSLEAIEIPETVKSFGSYSQYGFVSYTFGGCTKLKTINIPSGVTTLYEGCFMNSGLDSIYIPNTVTRLCDNCLSTPNLRIVKTGIADLSKLSYSQICFGTGNIENTDLFVPKGSLNVYQEYEPWSNFKSLQEYGEDGEIFVPEQININHNGIKYILKDGVAIVARQSSTLSGDIIIPEKISYDDIDYPVTSIISPTDLVCYSGNTISCTGGAFQGTQIRSVNIPSSITTISAGAFQNCSNLTKVVLPATIKMLSAACFAGCINLEDINIPEGITDLASYTAYGYRSYVFGGCKKIKEFIIPSGVTTLASGCFLNSGLEKVSIPENCTSMDEDCLDAPDLLIVTMYVRDLDKLSYTESCFGNISNTVLRVPKGSKQVYQEYYPWMSFSSIEEFDDGYGEFVPSKITTRIDDIRYILSGDNATIGRQNKDLSGHIIIPSSVTYEGKEYIVNSMVAPTGLTAWSSNTVSTENGAFQSCPITSITIPASVTSIAAGAFYNCKDLESINLADGLKQLGAACFAGCSKIVEIKIPETVTDFGSYTRYGYKSYIFGNCTSLRKVNIPKSITKFTEGCFKGSGLETFIIPSNVVRLEEDCFSMNGLKGIKITHSDLNALTYTESIFSNVSNVLLYVPEGTANIYNEFYPWKNFKKIIEYKDQNDEFNFNAYSVTYVIPEISNNKRVIKRINSQNNESVYSKEYIPSGIEISRVDSPFLEGYTFSGWSEIPETMPAHDVTITGTFSINKYKLAYTVDGEEYKIYEMEYGAAINPETAPTKEGYTFSGWSEIPETMPAKDVTVTGTFTINKYKLTYMVDSEEYKSYDIEYGASITPEVSPTKEGYTFSGWSDIPETMPAKDVTVTGLFAINKYKLTYIVDGEDYKTYEIEYGATITPEVAPTKEGYTFSGWSETPETMPANDVTVTGSFTINSYKLTYMIDDKVYKETMYEYGATITPEPAPDGDFVNFEWIELPETMPAHDVIVTGTYEKAYIPGDANGDGLVNVTDIVATVNYIMDNPSDNFNKDAADLNGDGIVNVTDIVQMVNIIMNGNGASSRRAAATSSNLIISGNNIQLRNADTYTAVQFDINLSDGQSISNIVLNGNSNHSLSWKMIDAKNCRVVVYSMSNEAFCVNDDNLFDISLSGDQDVTISNELLVEADGTTGIDVIRREAENGKIYDLNGRQVKNPRKGLYIINGRKVIVK